MDPQLKQLMKELGDAINESLSDSEQIPELKVSDQDLKFLKSLRIKIDEDHHEKGK